MDARVQFNKCEVSREADLAFDLKYCSAPLIKIGISYGLGNYFCPREIFSDDKKIQDMINASHNLFGVTLVQSPRGMEYVRQEAKHSLGDYRKLCIELLEQEMGKRRIELSFFLPGRFAYWNLEQVRDINNQKKPSIEVLLGNYDNLAKRCGFVFDAKSNLFWRK